MNTKRETLAPVLQVLLDYLNIQQVDTYHIGFMIAPRVNASGRVAHAEQALKCLLAADPAKQLEYLELLDQLNGERRVLQEQMIKEATSLVDEETPLIVAASATFHEGIIGIVAGRLADKYNKPSVVLSIDEEKGVAVGSLR
jgi:single-stranded-DNA-specific exonuclease